MRKEIVYSLAAMATIPVVANAASVKTNTLVSSALTDGVITLTPEGSATLANGENYQVVFNNVFCESALTVQIKQGDALRGEGTITNGTATQTVDFSISGTEAVVITVSGAGEFTLGNPYIGFKYDFAKAAHDLDSILAQVTPVIFGYKNDHKDYDNSRHDEFQGDINLVAAAETADADANVYKNVYQRFWLDRGIGNDSITTQIKLWAADAKDRETAYLKELLADLQEAIDDLAEELGDNSAVVTALQHKADSIGKVDANGNVTAGLIKKFVDGEMGSADIYDALTSTNAERVPTSLAKDVADAEAAQAFYENTVLPNLDALDSAFVLGRQKIDSVLAKAPASDLKPFAKKDTAAVATEIAAIKADILTARKAGTLDAWNAADNKEKARVDSLWKEVEAKDIYGDEGVIPALVNKYDSLADFKIYADSVEKGDTLFGATLWGGGTKDYKTIKYVETKYAKALAAAPKAVTDKLKKEARGALATLKLAIDSCAKDSFPTTKLVSTYRKAVVDSLNEYSTLDIWQKLIDKKDSLIMSLKDSINYLDTAYVQEVGSDKYQPRTFYAKGAWNNYSKGIGKLYVAYDSVMVRIQELEDSITKATTVAKATALSNGTTKLKSNNQTFLATVDDIAQQIAAMTDEAKKAALKWDSLKVALANINDSLTAFENSVKDKALYLSEINDKPDGSGTSYGGYKSYIDKIKSSATKNTILTVANVPAISSITDSLAKAMQSYGAINAKSHTQRILAINASDTATIQEAIEALKANYEQYLSKEDSLSKVLLKASTRQLLDSLIADSARIHDNLVDPDAPYGPAAASINENLQEIRAALAKQYENGKSLEDSVRISTDPTKNAYDTDFKSLGDQAKVLQELIDKMRILKKRAENALEEKVANDEAKEAADKATKKVEDLLKEIYDNTKKTGGAYREWFEANKDENSLAFKGDSAWWEASYKRLKDIFDADTTGIKKDSADAKLASTLEDWNGRIDSLKNAVQEFKDTIINKVANFEAYKSLNEGLYRDVATAHEQFLQQGNTASTIADFKESEKAEPRNTEHNTHYKNEVERIWKEFQGENAEDKAGEEYDPLYSERDTAYADYLRDSLSEKKLQHMQALVGLIDQFDKLPGRVQKNISGYESLLTAFADVEALKEDAEDALDEYELSDKAAKQKALEDILAKINTEDKTKNPDTLYKKGLCEDVTALLAEINKAKEDLGTFMAQLAENYDAKLLAENQLRKDIVDQAIAEAREAYKQAVKTQNDYKDLTNPLLREAVKKADELSDGYNEKMAKHPANIDKLNNDFSTAYAKAVADNEAYSIVEDTAKIHRETENIQKEEKKFKDDVYAAVSDALDAYVADIAADTLVAAQARDGFTLTAKDTDKATDDLAEDLAEIKDQFAALQKAVTKRDSSGIKKIDECLNELEGYELVLAADIEEAAQEDIEKGLEKAQAIITKGDNFFATFPEDNANKKSFDSQKETILGSFDKDGKLVQAGVIQLIDSIEANADTTYAENYGPIATQYNAEYGQGYQVGEKLKGFLEHNMFSAYDESEKQYALESAALDKLQQQLDDSIASMNEAGYAVAEQMVISGGGFYKLQEKIDALRTALENDRKAGTSKFTTGKTTETTNDSLTIAQLSHEIEVVASLKSDTLKADSGIYVASPVAPTLIKAEKDFLDAKKNDLTTAFNQVAAAYKDEAEGRKVAKAWETKIDALYDRLTALFGKDAKKVLAADLLPYQDTIYNMLDTLTTQAGTDADTTAIGIRNEIYATADSLIEVAGDALDGVLYENLTEAEEEALEQDLNMVIQGLNALKQEVTTAETKDVIFNRERYEAILQAAEDEIHAIQAEAQQKSAANKKYADYFAKLDDKMEQLEENLDKKLEKFDDFKTVTPEDFQAKLALIAGRVAAMEAAIAEAEAEQDTVTIKPADVDQFATAMETSMDAIVNDAAKKDIQAIAADLKKQADAIVLDPDQFLATDYAALSARLQVINDSILKQNTMTNPWGGSFVVSETGLIHDAENATSANYDKLRKDADNIQKLIDALKEDIEDLGTGEPIDEDVRGKLTDDDVIDINDWNMLVDIIANKKFEKGELTEDEIERADINMDDKVTVTDLAWMDYYMANEAWPEVEEEVAARGWFAKAETMSIQNLGTQDGVTRLAINLNNDADYTAFQMDLQLPAGAVMKSATLGERVENGYFMTADYEDGNVRLFTLPSNRSSINGNEGAVVYLDIEGLNGEITGTATMVKKNFTDASFELSATTGIDKLKNVAASAGQKVYNLGGKMMDGLKKGVNILRGEDGTAKKVIKK